jgi:Holliday junction resolvase RusA-like endonuclease
VTALPDLYQPGGLFPRPAPTSWSTAWSGPEPDLTVAVYGLPAPQGSKKHLGNGVMVESSKHVKPWRQDVKYAALAATQAVPGWAPLDGPLVAAMTFAFARPKGHYRTGRNSHLLRDTAPARPAVYPDLSKIIRSTEDALTGLAWVDDSRVVEYRHLAKHYTTDADTAPDVLDAPGAVIHIWRLT